MRFLLSLSCIVAFVFQGCEKETAVQPEPSSVAETPKKAAPEAPKAVTVSKRRILGAPLIVPVPAGWIFETSRPGPTKDDDTVDPDAPIKLRSRTLFSARAEKKSGAPWLLIMHDNNISKNTTASEYLDAQRASNRATLVNIKHVEAERSTLGGRPVYRVRDEWELNDEAFVQESLFMLDQVPGAKTKDGYSVVLTFRKSELEKHKDTVAKIFDAIEAVQ